MTDSADRSCKLCIHSPVNYAYILLCVCLYSFTALVVQTVMIIYKGNYLKLQLCWFIIVISFFVWVDDELFLWPLLLFYWANIIQCCKIIIILKWVIYLFLWRNKPNITPLLLKTSPLSLPLSLSLSFSLTIFSRQIHTNINLNVEACIPRGSLGTGLPCRAFTQRW